MHTYSRRGVESSAFTRMLKREGRVRPRTLVGAVLGTMLFFLAFVRHYEHVNDETAIFVWFGMRSDGRCGRDFATDSDAETTCGKGQCCSAHGWCGHGEEYCSPALGCQNGCWPADPSRADDDIDQDINHHNPGHHDFPVEDEYYPHHDRYGGEHWYDDGVPHHYYRGRGGRRYDDHYEDYHHRYDDMHAEVDVDDHEGKEDDGPELVGLTEEKHLGDGDGVPLSSHS